MSSLMYSSSDSLVSRQQLAQIPTPAALGRFHAPYPFHEFVEQVANQIPATSFELLNEEYAVTKDHQRFFGLMTVAPTEPEALEGEYISAQDWSLQIGLRGSHDQRIPRGLTLGSSVMVCSNLCFHGDLGKVVTKQTLNIGERIPQLVHSALSNLPQAAERNTRRFDSYRSTHLRPRHGDAALVEMHRRGGLSGAQLAHAIKEWDKPSYEAHEEAGYTVWRAFNAATQALKPANPEHGTNMDLVRQRSQVCSSFLDEVVGL